MPLPRLIAERIPHGARPAEVYASVPVPVRGGLAVFLYVTECKKFSPGVVEHPVYHHADAVPVTMLYECLKILVGSQPPVYRPVVPGVVAVGTGLKQRADVDAVEAHIRYVGDPADQLVKAMCRPAFPVLLRSAGHPQRVHVVKYTPLIPFAHSYPPMPSCAQTSMLFTRLMRNW